MAGFVVDDEGDDVQLLEPLPMQFSARRNFFDSFALWMEYLFFAMVDPQFQANVARDATASGYYAPRLSVEKRLQSLTESLSGGGHWDDTARR